MTTGRKLSSRKRMRLVCSRKRLKVVVSVRVSALNVQCRRLRKPTTTEGEPQGAREWNPCVCTHHDDPHFGREWTGANPTTPRAYGNRRRYDTGRPRGTDKYGPNAPKRNPANPPKRSHENVHKGNTGRTPEPWPVG